MEDILKEAKNSVQSTINMIEYYEKEIKRNQESKANAIEKAIKLATQHNEVLKKLGLPPEDFLLS